VGAVAVDGLAVGAGDLIKPFLDQGCITARPLARAPGMGEPWQQSRSLRSVTANWSL
jgi:hypothetical protein